MPWDKISGNGYWKFGVILGVFMLIGQIVYFEGYAFSQNVAMRPFLSKLCRFVNCQLPVYKNLDELNILQSSFTSLSEQSYLFRVVLNNQADFPQDYPNIRLTLLDYNGNPFAYRVFHPSEYLAEDSDATVMDADATTEISLKIAAPNGKIGGSSFDLVN